MELLVLLVLLVLLLLSGSQGKLQLHRLLIDGRVELRREEKGRVEPIVVGLRLLGRCRLLLLLLNIEMGLLVGLVLGQSGERGCC